MSDISVYVTSDLTSSERRISPQWKLSYLKSRLEFITGIDPKFQLIHYYPIPTSNEYTILENSDQTVHDLQIIAYSRLHIIDQNPDSELGELSNSETVEFKLSEEEYQKRQDSVLSWKQNNNLGRFDPNFNRVKTEEQKQNEEKAHGMKVGDRCRVINIEGERRGLIKFLGKIDLLDNGDNIWVGIEFDEPVGKNNGSINGVVFFTAKNKHGSFVKPKHVEVGDFPELDPFDDDDDDEEL